MVGGLVASQKATRQMYRPQVDEQCRPRKSDPTDIAGRVGDSEWRPLVQWGKPGISGEEMGKCTQRARRGKSWRHVQKDLTCNWRDPGELTVARESEVAIAYLKLAAINCHREGSLAWKGLLGGRSI